MPSSHTVVEGECLASIAARFGFRKWRTVYDDDANADLRSLRPDPNVLSPGDIVTIPDRQVRDEAADTGKRHTYFVASSPTTLRLKIDYERDFDYELTVDGVVVKKGSADSDTPIIQAIAASAASGSITVWAKDLGAPRTPANGFTYQLELGFLDPVEKVTGVQGRLTNLGFYHGPVDGRLGPKTAEAIRAFERSIRAPETGVLTRVLTAALFTAHDKV
ncbi:MAG: peptidoglycan-binding protein [Byssovorax sp.]